MSSLNSFWELNRPVTYGIRKDANQQYLYANFEYLYERLSAHRNKNAKVEEKAKIKGLELK